MRKITSTFIVGVMLLVGATFANAAVLTFDDIATDSYGWGAIPTGYSGFSWNSSYYDKGVIDAVKRNWTQSGYYYGAVSGSNVLYFYIDSTVSVTNSTPFSFAGVYLTPAWNDGIDVTLSGYLDGNLVGTVSATDLYHNNPEWLAADFGSVDTLQFKVTDSGFNAQAGGAGDYFALDNFTFSEATSVPEPSTILLLGAGLAGACFLRRRKSAR